VVIWQQSYYHYLSDKENTIKPAKEFESRQTEPDVQMLNTCEDFTSQNLIL
jgi:hypothetical protein